jgi:hypothetical protein
MTAREEERCCIMYFGHGVNIIGVVVREHNSKPLFDTNAGGRTESLNVQLVDSQISDCPRLRR